MEGAAATAEGEAGKALLEVPADVSRSAKSPPRLQIPAQPQQGMDDNYLFSPGVDTPGHKLPVGCVHGGLPRDT